MAVDWEKYGLDEELPFVLAPLRVSPVCGAGLYSPPVATPGSLGAPGVWTLARSRLPLGRTGIAKTAFGASR